MILYSPTITARLRYTCAFIGKELGHTIVVTDKPEIFREGLSPCVNYSYDRIEGQDIWVKPHSLLFEKGIQAQVVDCFEENGQKKFFRTRGELSFDVFAAIFYLLSRYEEYLPHTKDMYGRYAHEHSLAYREHFLDRPLINEWLQDFNNVLKLPAVPVSSFRFIPTYDIDEAFSFRHKEWERNAGAAIKDLLKGNWKRWRFRRDVLSRKTDDPFDSYAWIDALHRECGLNPRYFFLLAEKTGQYDRNILPGEKALQAIILEHAGKYPVGIHPSWQSGDDPSLLSKEIEILAAITGKQVVLSRQHFIRFNLPGTFRRLVRAGIQEDHSMGYGSINGFRASVASPFYWYDLEKEEQTTLLLYPFCYMEANSFYEQKISPEAALQQMRHYYNAVRRVNGTLVTIWHNTFLGTDPNFQGWREVYEQFVKEVTGQV